MKYLITISSLLSYLLSLNTSANSPGSLMSKYQFDKSEVAYSLNSISGASPKSTSYNISAQMIPASVTKILTTLFALDILGDEYKFKTQVYYSGSISNAIINGDIYLKGSGDPYLKSSEILNLILELKGKGIKKVQGKFYYDDTAIPRKEMIYENGHQDHSYNSSLSGLNSDFNQFMVRDHKPIPNLQSLSLKKSTDKFPNEFDFQYKDANWYYSVQKTYKLFETLPVKNSSLYTSELFQFIAKKLNIKIPYPKEKKTPSKLKMLAEHSSLPLYELAKLCLEYSNNLFAEVLLLAAAKHNNKKIINMYHATEALKKWARKSIPSPHWNDFKIENGSGLTSKNRLSPRLMDDILKHAYAKKYQTKFYWPLLSYAGHSGWIKKRFLQAETNYNLWAKTGSLDYVSSIAGYLRDKNGTLFTYSIFINNKAMREKTEKLLKNKSLPRDFNEKTKMWKERAKKFQNELIQSWN